MEKPEMNRVVGENIKRLREKKNLTQKSLGELLGVHSQMIIKWEAAVSIPRQENIEKLE